MPLPAEGSSRQSQKKIGRSIQVVLKVVSAPARFCDRGARCFAVMLCVWERLVIRLQREEIYWLFEARPALKMLCQKKSRRRERLGATEGMNGGHAVDGGSRL